MLQKKWSWSALNKLDDSTNIYEYDDYEYYNEDPINDYDSIMQHSLNVYLDGYDSESYSFHFGSNGYNLA